MNATSRLQPAVQPALQLIQRDDCPLCDQALAVLAAARAPELESVWIDDVDELEAAYGMRVPVLRDTVTGAELEDRKSPRLNSQAQMRISYAVFCLKKKKN